MESAFCFEIAIDELKFRKGISCEVPFVSVVFLNFPTITIHLNKAKHQKTNSYSFQKGKSCLFRKSPTQLYEQLTCTPVYLLILDQNLSSDISKQQQCVGTSAFALDKAIQQILHDITKCGLHRTSSFGETLTIALCNIMQDTIGYVEIAYKLTCLGHAMLPHLPMVQVTTEDISAEGIKYEIPIICDKNKDFDNEVVCPPCLYYQAEKVTKQKAVKVCSDINSEIKENKDPDQLPLETSLERKKILQEWKHKTETFIQVKSTAVQKSESTQTGLEHLNHYPVLQSLIKEVVQLGLNPPSMVEEAEVLKIKSRPKQEIRKGKPLASTIVKPKISPLKQRPQTSSAQTQKSFQKVPTKKKYRYPLSYGLTKSHLLRLSMNKQPDFSQTYTKSTAFEKPKRSKKLSSSQKRFRTKRTHSHRLVSTYTQTLNYYSDQENESLSEGLDTDNESVELPFAFNNIREVDDLSPDKSSPRVMSRQSIEIRLPSALTEEPPEDDFSSKYRYSDDFDEDQSSATPASSITSIAPTTVDSSPQHTSYDTTTKEDSGKMSPHRLSFSPQPIISELSPSVSFKMTPRDSIPEEPEKEYLESIVSTVDDEKVVATEEIVSPPLLELPSTPEISHLSPKSPEVSYFSPKTPSPKYESQDDDSKPTDDSASIATTVMATKLPIPAPSSDSPVIRSLVSEPGGRKPRPPRVSQSSSMERIHRKYKKSSESFQISDLSDVRTSDLADIKTSDLSDLKSTADSISPIHSTDALSSNLSLPNLLKKKKKVG